MMIGALLCPAVTVLAGDARPPPVDSLQTIVVQAQRLRDDEELKIRVATALHDDPFLYDGHVEVSVRNGIVRLEGVVLSPHDVLDALRIIRKHVPGVRRVVDELEICNCYDPGP
jgi:osmotically-inducible protein OsmY